MNYFYSVTLVLIVSVLRCTEAWTLDSSCRSDGNRTSKILPTSPIGNFYQRIDKKLDYQATIENGMRQAFIYNEAALDALSAIGSQSNVNDPIHIAQHDLFQYVFRVAMKDGKIDPSYSKFKKVRSAFQAVKRFDKTGDGLSSPLAEDVPQADGLIVYCDWARFEEGKSCSGKKHAGVACDLDLQQDVAMGPLYKSCKTGQTTAPMTFTHHEGKSKYAQIQLCSEYLKNAHKHPLKFWKDISLQALLAKPKAVVSNILKGAEPIDVAAAGISHTLFHDMIHAIGNGEIGDIHVHETGVDGLDEGDPERQACYGWANCLRFSPYGPNREKMGKAHALENADNYAYFGLGASLISPAGSGKPQRINPDGSLQVIPTSKQRRENLHRRALAMPAVPRDEESTPSNTTGSLPPASPSTKPATTEPATTEPTSTKPTDLPPASPSTKPSTTEPVTTEPVTTEPTSTKQTDLPPASPSSKLTSTKPTESPPASPSTKPTNTEPVTTEPANPKPVTTEPATTKPRDSPPASPSTKATSTKPTNTQPANTKLATTTLTTTKPSSIKPTDPPPPVNPSSKAATTEPVTTEPITTQPANTEPANTQPVSTQPTNTEPGTTLTTTKQASTKPTDPPLLASPSSKAAITEPANTQPANTEPTSTGPVDSPTANPSTKPPATKPGNTEPTGTTLTDSSPTSPSSKTVTTEPTSTKPTDLPPASPGPKHISTKPIDSPPASPSTKLATTEPVTTKPTGLPPASPSSKPASTKPTDSPPGSPSSKPTSTGPATEKPTNTQPVTTKRASTKPTDTPPASPSSIPASPHNSSVASTTPHTRVTPSNTAEAVITPRYDFQDMYGDYNFFDVAQSVLSALEANTVSPVTGITPTPSATFTTPVLSPTTKKTPMPTPTPTPTSTRHPKPTPSAPGLWCAPTGGASVGVPVEYARNNVTDFCSLEKSSMFGAARYDLPVIGSNIRNYENDYDLPGVTIYLNISLVTGEFNITQDVCHNTMHEILNDCAPYQKQGKAQHLLKFGGGIPVKGSKGTASFNISLEADGGTSS